MSDGPLRYNCFSSGRGRYWANAAGTELHSQPWFVSSAGCFRHYVFFPIGCVSPCSLRFGSEEKNLSKNKQNVDPCSKNCLQSAGWNSSLYRSCSTVDLFLFFKSDPNWEVAVLDFPWGIVHRDLKLENFLRPSGNWPLLKSTVLLLDHQLLLLNGFITVLYIP